MLEVLMYHKTAVDESGEFLVEVIDYCYKKIMRRVGLCIKERKGKREREKEEAKMS